VSASTTSVSQSSQSEGYSSKTGSKPYGEVITFAAIKDTQLINGPLPTSTYGKSAY